MARDWSQERNPPPRAWAIDESMDDWWSLTVGGIWPGGSSVEGPAEDWLAVAEAIETGGRASSKRCAVMIEPPGAVLWSPRNCTGPSDVRRLSKAEADALAVAIRATLAEAAARPPRPAPAGDDE